jgi:hypothetical protein
MGIVELEPLSALARADDPYRYIRYSAKSDGSNMTLNPNELTKYRGVGALPNNLRTNPNLFNGTGTYSGSQWMNLQDWTISNTGQKTYMAKTTVFGSGLTQNAYVQSGNTYVFSVSSMRRSNNPASASDLQADLFTGGSKPGDAVATISEVVIPLNLNSWVITYFVFNVTSSGNVRPSFKLQNSAYELSVISLNLKIGTIPQVYSESVDDWIAVPSNYVWSEIVIRYAVDSIGTSMTENQTVNTPYKGTGYMTPSVYGINKNLQSGTGSFEGFKQYESNNPFSITPNTLYGNRIARYDASMLDVANSATYFMTKNTPEYAIPLEAGYYAMSVDVKVSDLSALDSGLWVLMETYSTSDKSGGAISSTNISVKTKLTELGYTNGMWVRLSSYIIVSNPNSKYLFVGFESISGIPYGDYTVDFHSIKVEKQSTQGASTTEWTPTPAEWKKIPSNYTWELIQEDPTYAECIAYSPNEDGTNLTLEIMPDSKYRGIGYMPSDTTSPSDWKNNKTNYAWDLIDETGYENCIAYSPRSNLRIITLDKQSDSTYVGLGKIPKRLVRYPNLVKYSNFISSKSPVFTKLYPNLATISTEVVDGYKCSKIVLNQTAQDGLKGVSIGNNSNALYDTYNVEDYVMCSFLIKGDIKWDSASPRFELSTEMNIVNKKESYVNWERVIWIGKKTDISGAFIIYSNDKSAQTFYIREICFQKYPSFTGYKIAPQDWKMESFNYVWEPIENGSYVRRVAYSPNSDGMNLTSERQWNSKYMGVGYMPIDIYITENIIARMSPFDWLNTPSNYTWTQILGSLENEHIDHVDGIFPITNVKLSNGIYYHINITKDTSLSYSRLIPEWTYYTILDCPFVNSLNGGNTNILLSQLEGLVIKRRRVGTFKWVTFKEIKVNSPADLNIVYQDSFLPSLHEFEYALVPILNGNIEGEYVTNTIKTQFNGVFISDKNTIFKLYNGVVYGGSTGNKASAYIPTIGNKYPTYISNSVINYRTGQVSALLLGYKFEKSRTVDRLDVVTQTNDLIDFLNNGEAKIITDWNGGIELVRVDANPTIAYNSSYGNGVDTVSFGWTEQGQYDEQDSLYGNGLVDTIG